MASLALVRSREAAVARRDLSATVAGGALAGLVAVSAVVRGLAAQRIRSPWILPDELIYGELARSFAATAHFALRGADTTGYSLGYPFLLSPAFLLRDPVAAYDAARWLNALLMSLAAVPVFLLARRLLSNARALLVAALALLVPSFAYTGELLSENASYPVFLTALLLIVRALERPTALRQVVALTAIVAACATRVEGLVLLPALVLAIAILAVADAAGRGAARRTVWAEAKTGLLRFRLTFALLALGAAAVPLAQAARGRPVTSLLGVYAAAVHGYSLAALPRWLGYHLVDLELYLGVLPFVPATVAIAAAVRRPRPGRPERAVAAAGIATVACLAVLVAAIASRPMSRAAGNPFVPAAVHERYLFYLAPIYLLFFVSWLERRRELGSRTLLVPLVAGSALLPLTLPFAQVHANADFEALALLPWSNRLIGAGHVPLAMSLAVLALSLPLLVRRPSVVLLQVGLVAVALWFLGAVAGSEMRTAARQVPTSRAAKPGWVDEAAGPGARVAVLWARDPRWRPPTALAREQALWQAELFNRSIVTVLYAGSRMSYDLPQRPATVRAGRLAGQRLRYVLTTANERLAGAVVARDRRAGLVLYRLAGA